LIEVVAAKLIIVCSGQNGIHAAADGDNCSVRPSAANIGDNGKLVDRLIVARVICEESGDGLVNNLQYRQLCSSASIRERLLLRVGKVGRDGNHCAVNLLSQEIFSGLAEATNVSSGNFGYGDS